MHNTEMILYPKKVKTKPLKIIMTIFTKADGKVEKLKMFLLTSLPILFVSEPVIWFIPAGYIIKTKATAQSIVEAYKTSGL